MEPRRITTPLSTDLVRSLTVGDLLLLSGQIVTGRDKAHKFLVEERPSSSEMPFSLEGGVIYHCGPLITVTDDTYRLIAAGPTTSMRVELYEPEVIRLYTIKAIIGKGGMGEGTREALKSYGCVYLHAISGAAAYLADRVTRVVAGWKIEEFGSAEAMWLLEVKEFPLVVTMDAKGNSLHKDVEQASLAALKKLLA